MTPTRSRHRRRTTVLLTILITSVVALGAIGAAWAFGWNLAEEGATAPTPSAVSTNQPYANSAALVAAIKATGVGCAGFRKTSSTDEGICATQGGDLVIAIYTNLEDRKATVRAVIEGGRARHMVLMGPNWTIYGPDAAMETLTEQLGGTSYKTLR